VVGAEGPGQLEPLGEPVDDDDRPRPHVAAHRGGLDPEAPRPLDEEAVAEAEAGLDQAVDDLGEGAVDRGDQPVRQLVGHAEEEAAGAEVVVLGEGADPVRELARPGGAPTLGARGSLLRHVAAAARVKVRVGDPVAFLQGPAQRVGLDAGPEPGHAAGHLVTEDPAVLGDPDRRIAPPEMQIGATDVGAGHADEDAVGLHLGKGHIAELEGLAGLGTGRLAGAGHRGRTSAKDGRARSC
jgi:hypothetical protein